MGKKAQVSLSILLGIILLFSIASLPFFICSTISKVILSAKESGYFELSNNDYDKPLKMVDIGGHVYPLRVGEAYIITAGQTALTKALAPSVDADQLQSVPSEFREKVYKVGHMAILYVDYDGTVRLSESSFYGGVKDVPFAQSPIYNFTNELGGVYSFTNVDSSKIIAGSKADGKKNINWFFLDFGNWYRSCAGHISILASYGGVDIKSNVKYLPLQNNEITALSRYVQEYLLKGSLNNRAVATVYGASLYVSIFFIDKVSYVKYKLGFGPVKSVLIPTQVILGNLEKGVIKVVNPVK